MLNTPVFIVNLKRDHERYVATKQRIQDAGYTNITRWNAVDATNPKELHDAWLQQFNNVMPTFEPADPDFVAKVGKQGLYLSMISLWKHMIDNKIQIATIFEDDIMFHPQWSHYAQQYWTLTPKTFDILYIGNQLHMPSEHHIDRVPVYCLHAYMLTLEGATKLYNLVKINPCTLDFMLAHYMCREAIRKIQCPFNWFVWNGTFFPTEHTSKKNTGLVYQDDSYESSIEVVITK